MNKSIIIYLDLFYYLVLSLFTLNFMFLVFSSYKTKDIYVLIVGIFALKIRN